MKKLITLIAGLPILLALLLAGCGLDAPDGSNDLVAPAGAQLFTDYVAIGNSLTAGYMDNGLAIRGQLSSYPRIIAQQMGLDVSIGDSDFTQPYVSMPGIGGTKDPVNHPADAAGVLYWNGSSPTVLDWTPLSTVLDPGSGFLPLISLPRPYHNLGVPGALLHDVMNAYSSATSVSPGNSFFDFINRASFFDNVTIPATPQSPAYESASMFRQALAKGPKVLTCWIGNNDILGSATAGTDLAITPVPQFQAEYTALVQTMAGGLVQRNGFPSAIILANIPSITTIPYFVPRTFLEAAAPQGLGIAWPWGYEEDTAQLLCFPGLSWLQDEDNQGSPVPANLTLSAAEVTNIETAVATFNGIIAAVAEGVNASGYAQCAVMDANALMTREANMGNTTHFMFLALAGMPVRDAADATLFSLDGVHPNNRGYAVIANEFIDTINGLLGTDVPDVDPMSAVFEWDPTYGQVVDTQAAVGALGRLDARVAESMASAFQR